MAHTARRRSGYAVITDDSGKTWEADTLQCRHCQAQVHFKPHEKFVLPSKRAQEEADCGGFCMVCRSFICGPCSDTGKCEPFEEKLQREETADIRRRALSLLLGSG